MALTERDHDLIAIDKVFVDVRMGLACWDFVLRHLPRDDETIKTIRNACRNKLEDLIPDVIDNE